MAFLPFRGMASGSPGGPVISATSPQEFQKALKHPSAVILVDFYANWCGPCRLLTPLLTQSVHRWNDANQGKMVQMVKVDIDAVEGVAGAHGVSALPTVVGFYQGQEIGRFVGAKDAASIDRFIASLHRSLPNKP